jgi:hypothetical protein
MNSYAIGSDSPRWWWPSATAGAVGAAAIAAILVLPAGGSTLPHGTTPTAPPVMTGDPWVTTTDPTVGRQCFLFHAPRSASYEPASPTCGHRYDMHYRRVKGVRRLHLDARP